MDSKTSSKRAGIRRRNRSFARRILTADMLVSFGLGSVALFNVADSHLGMRIVGLIALAVGLAILGVLAARRGLQGPLSLYILVLLIWFVALSLILSALTKLPMAVSILWCMWAVSVLVTFGIARGIRKIRFPSLAR